MKLLRPEIESQTAASCERAFNANSENDGSHDIPPPTDIDVLEIHEENISWKEGVDDVSIQRYMGPRDPERPVLLRIFFFKTQHNLDNLGIQVNPKTLKQLQEHFFLSPIFLACLLRYSPRPSGAAKFPRVNTFQTSRLKALEGFYRNESLMAGFSPFISFYHEGCHKGSGVSSTYFIAHCPKLVKHEIVRRAHGKDYGMLLRPCAIDSFLLSEYFVTFDKHFDANAEQLHRFDDLNARAGAFTNREKVENTELLHELMRNWHKMYAHTIEKEHTIQFVIDILRVCQADLQHACFSSGDESIPLVDNGNNAMGSLKYLQSLNQSYKTWISCFRERTSTQINLAYSLAAQRDSKTNIHIAELTSDIAVEAQRDSSSMITIAAVTMLFLPGTFICAVFSMVFFNIAPSASGSNTTSPDIFNNAPSASGSDTTSQDIFHNAPSASGSNTTSSDIFTVSPRLWYFAAITIPLTLLVFAVWIFWSKQRTRAYKLQGASTDKHILELEAGDVTPPSRFSSFIMRGRRPLDDMNQATRFHC